MRHPLVVLVLPGGPLRPGRPDQSPSRCPGHARAAVRPRRPTRPPCLGPGRENASVAVEHDDTDPLGARLAYRLKELIGRSALMHLSGKDEKRSLVVLRTKEEFPGRPNPAPSIPSSWPSGSRRVVDERHRPGGRDHSRPDGQTGQHLTAICSRPYAYAPRPPAASPAAPRMPVQTFTVTAEEAGQKLLQYLARRLGARCPRRRAATLHPYLRARSGGQAAPGLLPAGHRPARARAAVRPGRNACSTPKAATAPATPLDYPTRTPNGAPVVKPAGLPVHPGSGHPFAPDHHPVDARHPDAFAPNF